MTWPCYWLEPAGRVALGLRRYAWSPPPAGQRAQWTCQAGYHDAFTWRGLTAPARLEEHDGHWHRPRAAPAGHGDPAWPAVCGRGCGYAFTAADHWQEWEEPIYWRPAGGGLYTWHTGVGAPPGCQVAGPGAMRDGWWLPASWRGPDGIALVVRLPDPARPAEPRPHDWIVDGPSSSGGRWARAGDPRHPPSLTVTPSIAAGEPGAPGYYHGFLTSGVLTGHLG